jgi:hypothetical protein
MCNIADEIFIAHAAKGDKSKNPTPEGPALA